MRRLWPKSWTTRAENIKQPQDDPARLLDRKIGWSRLALVWERTWPMLWPPLGVAGLFLLTALLGLWEMLPTWAHLNGLAAFLIAFGIALAPIFRLRWPGRDDARRRLDADPILPHRPATGYQDTLAGTPSPATEALWRAHRARLAAEVARLKVALPSPRLMNRDPYALRAALIVALVAAFSYAGPNWRQQIAEAVTPIEAQRGEALRVDAWITPPAYTGRAPIFLADGSSPFATLVAPEQPIAVPAGSDLVLRLHGDDSSEIVLAPTRPGESQSFRYDGSAESSEIGAKIVADSSLTITGAAGAGPAEWHFAVVPDRAPEIALAGEIETTPDQALKLTYSIKDDYGVLAADAHFALAGPTVGTEPTSPPADGPTGGIAASLELEIDTPDFALVLPGLRVRNAVKEMFRDLTAHPWAGLEVELTLIARDEAGQEGTSNPERLTLPERTFNNPLARSVIEQRRNLVRTPTHYERVARALNALTIAPHRFIDDTSVYLGLRSAYLRTRSIQSNTDLSGAVDHLWDVALGIEDGDLSIAERNLRAAQEALARALSEDASDEEIERLMAELRQALDRFVEALREQAKRLAESGAQMPQIDSQFLERHDLNQMMDMIERLAKSGARDAAQELLAQLQNLLESVQGGMMAQLSPEQSLMSELLDELGKMIGEQQKLMDETFKQGQRQDQQQGQQEGQQQGRMGERGRVTPMPGAPSDQSSRGGTMMAPGSNGDGQPLESPGGRGASLAEQQRMLRESLEALRQRLGEGGLNAPAPLDRAGREMGEAEQDLKEDAPSAAVNDQRAALDQLRQGARSLAQELAQGLSPTPGPGQPGQSSQSGPTDPLGRPMRTTGPEFGLTVKVPDEIDAETARKLREELQRRLGDQYRRSLELDYIERLLERF